MALASHQGLVKTASFVGHIYSWGHGVAIDRPRAMAAYKVGARGGDAVCQHQLGMFYYSGIVVDVDHAQALPWIEKAAAQNCPQAVYTLGVMYSEGEGVTPSWRRAREYYERAIELGESQAAVETMSNLTQSIQNVRSRRSNHSALSPSLVRDLTLPHTQTPYPRTHAGRPPLGQAGGDPRHEPRGHERQVRRRHRLPPDRRAA